MQYVAIFCYTIQLITIKLCTKFQNPKSSSCQEIFDRKNVHMFLIGVTEGNMENMIKRKQNEDNHLNFHLNNTLCLYEGATKFENTGSNRSREICDRNFHWK